MKNGTHSASQSLFWFYDSQLYFLIDSYCSQLFFFSVKKIKQIHSMLPAQHDKANRLNGFIIMECLGAEDPFVIWHALTLSWRILSACVCVCVCVCACVREVKTVMITSAFYPFLSSSLVRLFPFDFLPQACTWNYVYLKWSQERRQNNRDCIYPPKAASVDYCQSLSRFYVKLPIHAVSIDQTTKCLFIFFSIQLVFSWLSDSSFISVSECPVLNG